MYGNKGVLRVSEEKEEDVMAASAASTKTKKTFGQWFRSRKVQQWLVILSFMLVPVLLLIVRAPVYHGVQNGL